MMKTSSQKPLAGGKLQRGFTLIEMLVSVSILTLIVVLVSNLTNNATNTITNSSKRSDSDAQAREFLNRLGRDIATMVIHPNADYSVFKNALDPSSASETPQLGNDWMAFFAHNTGYFSGTSTPAMREIANYAILGYDAIDDDPYYPGVVVQRLSKGIGWNTTTGSWRSINFQSNEFSSNYSTLFASSTFPAFLRGTTRDDDFKTVGDQIFRFEYMYLLKPYVAQSGSQIVSQPARLSIVPFYGDTERPGHDAVYGFRDVAAIVVAIAVIDSKSKAQITDFTDLPEALRDAQNGQDIETLWQSDLANSNFASTAGIPEQVASSIRVYQRYFYLDTK